MTEEEYREQINHIDNLVRTYEITQEIAGKLLKKLKKERENKES